MPAFGGVRGTGDWGTDERPKNFREGIIFLNPNGTAPIFGLTSKMNKKMTVDDPEFSWWDEPNNIYRLQASAATSGSTTAGTEKTISVDTSDPAAGTLGNNYGSALNLVPGDILMVEAADGSSFNPQYLEVTSVASATSFKAKIGALGSTGANIANNAWLLKVGNMFAEGTRSPVSASRNPVKYTNKTQIFKTTYELTGTVQQTRARTGDPVANDKKRKLFDHSLAIETSILFGKQSEGTGSNGKPLRTMDGLRNMIPNSVLGASWTLDSFVDNVTTVFDWDSMAGDTRICFCGNGALNNLNKKIQAAQANGVVRVNYDHKEKMYGISFNRYMMPQGELYIKTHPLLSRHPVYTNGMYVLDGSNIKWVCLRNRDTRFKDNIQHNDEDTTKGMWMTEGSIWVGMGGLTMKYVGGFNN